MRLRFEVLSALVAAACCCTSVQASPVSSADLVCSPGVDPCIIDSLIEVSDSYALDFGLRVVRVEGDGQFAGSLDLRCGGFETSVAGTWIELGPSPDSRVSVTARRGCSNAPGRPCLSDRDCEAGGSCSIGDGGIRLAGSARGTGASVSLDAAADVMIEGKIDAAGNRISMHGGNVRVDAGGSIFSLAPIDIRAGQDRANFEFGESGFVDFTAGADVYLGGAVRAVGGYEVAVDAGQDVFVLAPVSVRGARGSTRSGGEIEIHAARHLTIRSDPFGPSTRLNMSGGTASDGYEAAAGAGGLCSLGARGDLFVGEGVEIIGNSGNSIGEQDDLPFAAPIGMGAGGNLTLNGRILAEGRGENGLGDETRLAAGGDLQIGSSAQIDLMASYGAKLFLSGRAVRIDGEIDLQSFDDFDRFNRWRGSGGYLEVGAEDLTIDGRILNGGGYGAFGTYVGTCAMQLGPTAVIDISLGHQSQYQDENRIYLGGLLVAEPGSVMLAKPGNPIGILYNPATPPRLQGYVDPPPVLTGREWLGPCNCGNSRVNLFETCDDGNTEAGDGCDEHCRVESQM